MKGRPRAIVRLCGLVPTFIVTLLSVYRPALLTPLEHTVYDTLVRAVPTHVPDDRVVIVDVDERSLSAIGQWPWRRDIIGSLVDRLRDLGAAAIALDIVFAESDRYGTGAGADRALAESLRGGRVLLGYAMTFDPAAKPGTSCVQHALGIPVVRRGEETIEAPFFHATSAICNLPELTAAANASGFLNAAPDFDGLLRRAPLLIELDGRIYPSLAVAAVMAATGTDETELRVVNVNASSLMLGRVNVPLDGKSNLLLRYRGPKRTFRYVSAADALSGLAGPEAFKNKVVFVGTTALGTREVVSTPLDTLFAGVEVQATVADNLLQQDFIRRPEAGATLETQAALGFGIVLALLVGRLGFSWAAFGVAGAAAAAWAAAFWLLSSRGLFISPLYPTLGLTSSLATMAVAQLVIEHRRADRAVRDRSMSQRLMVQSLLSLTASRDAETGRHSQRTQQYTRILAQQLSTHPLFRDYLTPEIIELLSSLAPLHDIGKVGVPDSLLNKPGALTVDELVEMRKHPTHGRDVFVNAAAAAGVHDDAILAMATDIAYTHHEKWDGSGYPQGLRGTQIPVPGRIMAVVDVYDATSTRRLYKQPMSHDDVVAMIVRGRGTHFDPEVVDAFVQVSEILRTMSPADPLKV
jgi:adenylate cyclase